MADQNPNPSVSDPITGADNVSKALGLDGNKAKILNSEIRNALCPALFAVRELQGTLEDPMDLEAVEEILKSIRRIEAICSAVLRDGLEDDERNAAFPESISPELEAYEENAAELDYWEEKELYAA